MLYSIQDGKELFEIIIFAILFFVSFKLHKNFIPKGYFTITEIVYFFDLKRFWTASNIRVFLIGAIIFLGYYAFGITNHTIYYSALLLVGVLHSIPVIQRYELYYFWRGLKRAALFLLNIFYVIVLFLMGFACLEFMIPAVVGKTGYFNQIHPSVSFGIGVVIYIVPIFLEFTAAQRTNFLDLMRIRFLHTDIIIILRNLDAMEKDNGGVIANYSKDILNFADKYNVSSNLLSSILLIEEFNRGSSSQQALERFLVYFLPSRVLKYDMSLGCGQVKITTASRLLSISKGEAMQRLMDPIQNIEICARYLALLKKQFHEVLLATDSKNPKRHERAQIKKNEMDYFDYVAQNYLGYVSPKEYGSVLYAAILRNRARNKRKK